MKIKKKHTYQTRDGRPVRIYTTKAGGEFCVHGAIYNAGNGVWYNERWTKAGSAYGEEFGKDDTDLVRVKEASEKPAKDVSDTVPKPVFSAWVNLYPSGFGYVSSRKDHAVRDVAPNCLGQVRLDYMGDGQVHAVLEAQKIVSATLDKQSHETEGS